MSRISFYAALLLTFVLGSCENATPPKMALDASYDGETADWRAQRLAELTAEEGYLSLAGFYWLENGKYTVGSDPNGDIVFPSGSSEAFLGDLLVTDDSLVTFSPAGNSGLTQEGSAFGGGRLNSSADSATKLRSKNSQFYIIERNDRLALRLEWFDAPSRTDFAGLEYFELNSDYIFDARFELYESPRKIKIGNVKDYVSSEESHGEIVVDIFGEEYRMQSIAEESDGKYFIIFGDETNGKSTYGGGRFIWVDAPDETGKTKIDFNRAYNPACAFTIYSTCPIPPQQNRISGPIFAGERKYTSI